MIEIGKVIILPTGTPGKELRSVLLPKRRRRFNWRTAWDRLLTAAGLTSFGVICYMMFCQLTGVK